MRTSEWLAGAAIVVTILIAGLAAWTTLERRISAVEKGLEKTYSHMFDVQGVARQEIINVLKEVHELKGRMESMRDQGREVTAHTYAVDSKT